MGEQCILYAGEDPPVSEWQFFVLSDVWPDVLSFRKPTQLPRLLSQVFRRDRTQGELPVGMPGRERIPNYVLREFHNLPNGNYSKRITRGYIAGGERVMLGTMKRAQATAAEKMQGLASVLDVGCAGGRMGDAMYRAGVEDVWGLDPSPYLLQHAAHDYPHIKFVQGVAEQTGFPDSRFDGVAACFLFHEMPPRYIDRSLAELHRILKPGGCLSISEPSTVQLQGSLLSLLRHQGLAGVYFAAIARFVYEPFLAAYHQQNMRARLAQQGFELLEDSDQVPIRQLFARKFAC